MRCCVWSRKPQERGGHNPRWVAAPLKKKSSCKWVRTELDSFGSNPLVIRTERTADPSSWLKGMQARNGFVCACLLPTNLNCSYTNSASTGLCISKLSINRYCITFLPYLSFAQTDGRQRASTRTPPSFHCFYFLCFLFVHCVKFHVSSGFFKFRVCKSVHPHTFTWINQQDAATFQVYYLSFKCSSTCFGHPHAHHQELQQLQ